jgi:hypothetical protein
VREQETALAWTVEQFLAVSRYGADVKRSAIKAIENLPTDHHDAYLLMHGSPEAMFESQEEAAWRVHQAARIRYPSVNSLARRLHEHYGIAPATFMEEQACSVDRDEDAHFVFCTDWRDPRIAGFHIFKAEDFEVGDTFAPPSREILDKAVFHAESVRYQATLMLWRHFEADDQEEWDRLGLEAAEEVDRLDAEVRRSHSVDELWADPALAGAVAAYLLVRTIGVSVGYVLPGLAIYDALAKVEEWAARSLPRLPALKGSERRSA